MAITQSGQVYSWGGESFGITGIAGFLQVPSDAQTDAAGSALQSSSHSTGWRPYPVLDTPTTCEGRKIRGNRGRSSDGMGLFLEGYSACVCRQPHLIGWHSQGDGERWNSGFVARVAETLRAEKWRSQGEWEKVNEHESSLIASSGDRGDRVAASRGVTQEHAAVGRSDVCLNTSSTSGGGGGGHVMDLPRAARVRSPAQAMFADWGTVSVPSLRIPVCTMKFECVAVLCASLCFLHQSLAKIVSKSWFTN